MSASSYPRSAAGACKTEYKRHKSFMNSEKKDEKEVDSKDPLPIVELKPFVKKVWRRENSLPGYYDRFSPSKPNPIIRKHKENETRRENRSPDPSPDRLEMVIGNLNNEMHASRKKSGSDSPRSRQHLHPKSETIAQKQIEHSQSLVPGFITRVERTKTTLMEIHDGEAPSRINCGLKQSLDRKVMDHPPVIDLKNDKFPNTPSKKSIQYANSFRGCYQKSNGIVRSAFNGISEERLHQFFATRYSNRHSSMMTRPKTPFYDAFDRNGTLPSINIGISSIRKRPSKQQNGLDEFDLSMNDLIPNHAHKVGGISNALHVMSKVGAPTQVERQLTFQLEVDLRRFRRSRDYFPFDMTPSELAKYYPPQSVNMTHGEILLRKGLESNTGPKKRRVREKSHKSAPDMLETNGSLLTESPRIDGDDIHQVAEVDRDGFIVNEYNTQYEIKENIVPKQFDTQHLADSAISPERDEIKAEEEDNIRTESQEHARAEPSPIKSVDTYATTPFEEPEPIPIMEHIPVITNRTLSPGDASDIIRNVMDANAVSENNTFRSVPTTTRTINETQEGLERSTTFLTSEQNNALPEVIPV